MLQVKGVPRLMVGSATLSLWFARRRFALVGAQSFGHTLPRALVSRPVCPVGRVCSTRIPLDSRHTPRVPPPQLYAWGGAAGLDEARIGTRSVGAAGGGGGVGGVASAVGAGVGVVAGSTAAALDEAFADEARDAIEEKEREEFAAEGIAGITGVTAAAGVATLVLYVVGSALFL